MICRFSAGALALTLAASAAVPARAQSEDQTPPIVVNIEGPCAVAMNRRATQCTGVAYMAFPDTGRIDFTALIDHTGWAFSGEKDDNQGGHYTLTVDSLVNPRGARVDAEGQCTMDIGEDGRTVTSIQCRARTVDGVMLLKASGVAKTDDDDDEDDDDGPDSEQG